jgi:hypothetical protein
MKNHFLLTAITFCNMSLSYGAQAPQTPVSTPLQQPQQLIAPHNPVGPVIIAQTPTPSQPDRINAPISQPTLNVELHSLDPSVFNTNNMIGLFKYIELRAFHDAGTRDRIHNWFKNRRQEILNVLNNTASKKSNTSKVKPLTQPQAAPTPQPAQAPSAMVAQPVSPPQQRG